MHLKPKSGVSLYSLGLNEEINTRQLRGTQRHLRCNATAFVKYGLTLEVHCDVIHNHNPVIDHE